ncbi:MAG TPA: phosphate ABC transporter substrate-binding protein PstS [Gemmatimonadales bacterium]|nr:phosphate ABC transporter substrate-binding protein PstS [Gemmatimonadales bacterium]
MAANRKGWLIVALVLAAGMPACSAGPREAQAPAKAPPGGVLLKGAGATFPAPLYQQWFAAYAATHPKIAISYEAVGSGEGIRRFLGKNVTPEERVDFGASDAALRDEEMAAVPGGVLLLPVTAGSVVLAYNLPEAPELRLSRRAYAGIFLGEIREWNHPLIAETNPGIRLPKLTISIVVRQDGSGTTFAMTKHLDAVSERWRARYGPATLVDWPGTAMRASGNDGVAGRIKQSIGSIGYVNYGAARKAGLAVATLQNRDGGMVHPGDASGMAALGAVQLPENLRLFVPDPAGRDAYPILTLTWILLYRAYPEPAKAEAIRDLFRWCLMEGQQQSGALGYVSLSPTVASKALAALQNVGPRAE